MLHSIFLLIVDTVASILVGVLLLRFWIQFLRVRPPISLNQFISQISNWIVEPLHRILVNTGKYDLASLAAAFLIVLLSVVLEINFFSEFNFKIIVLFILARFFQWIFYSLMSLLIIDVFLSWINPYALFASFIRTLNEPLLRHFRKVIPLIGNIDFSPLVALIFIQIIARLVKLLIFSFL